MRHARALAALVIAAAAGATWAADDPPLKSKPTLDEKVSQLGRQVADKRVALSKKLEKERLHRAAWEQWKLAIRISPDHPQAREKLGYKKKGSEWEGGVVPPPQDTAAPAKPLADEIEAIKRDAGAKLAALAKRAKAGGLDAEARATAMLALDESDEASAHELLGHQKGNAADDWTAERERKVRAAFAKALKGCDPGEPKEAEKEKGACEEEIQKAIESDKPLLRRESKRAVILASSNAERPDLESLARSAETTYAAFHYLFFDKDDGFSIEGEPKREATGAKELQELWKPRFVVLTKEEYQKFVEKLITDPVQKAISKNTTGGHAWKEGQWIAYAGWFKPDRRVEWVSVRMAVFLASNRFAKDLPHFAYEAVGRLLSGQVSGRADIYSVGGGTGSGAKRSVGEGPFYQLRRAARSALADGVADELRALFAKQANDMARIDQALSAGFLDWALAKERPALMKLFREWDAKSTKGLHGQIEDAFGKKLEELDEAWKAWTREDY